MRLNATPATPDQVKALALTNYGHFTSMLVEGGRARGLSLHLRRLARDCRQLFDVDLDTDYVRTCIRCSLEDGSDRTVVRITVYDPALDLGTIGHDAVPHVLVTTRPAAQGPPTPLSLRAAVYVRENPAVKHVGLFGALQHRRAAQRAGFDDVLFLNRDGTISEIATSNIGFVRRGQVVWPRSDRLAGVTMTLLQQARDRPVVVEPLTLSDLPAMDAAFATNAAVGIRPVRSVDGTHWPVQNETLRELRDLYADIPSERI